MRPGHSAGILVRPEMRVHVRIGHVSSRMRPGADREEPRKGEGGWMMETDRKGHVELCNSICVEPLTNDYRGDPLIIY